MRPIAPLLLVMLLLPSLPMQALAQSGAAIATYLPMRARLNSMQAEAQQLKSVAETAELTGWSRTIQLAAPSRFKGDYAAADVPMLPAVASFRTTARQMLAAARRSGAIHGYAETEVFAPAVVKAFIGGHQKTRSLPERVKTTR